VAGDSLRTHEGIIALRIEDRERIAQELVDSDRGQAGNE
jgi:hypothetical protein